MPVIRIDYDKKKFKQAVLRKMAVELQEAAAEASRLPIARVSVFTYANELTVNAAPVEIYVQVGLRSIPQGNVEKYVLHMKQRMQTFKKMNKITIPINISVVPMNWKFAIGV